MALKILVTELEYRKAEAVFASCADFDCICAPSEENALAEMIRREAARYVIVGVTRYEHALYQALPAGGVIARFGVGHDGIDKPQAAARGIYCTNTPGVLDDSVAECAIAMMLTAARNLEPCTNDMRRGEWRNRLGFELAGKTLAVIGCGNIGSKVAKIARLGFAMQVVGCDPTAPKQPECYDKLTSIWAEAVAGADFISLHIPSIPATRNFICRERLACCKHNAWLINTARGGVVDEGDLYDAVRDGVIAGAVLDVFQQEPYQPLPGKDLRTLPNVIATPHIGSSTTEACDRMAAAAIANIRCAVQGDLTKMSRIG